MGNTYNYIVANRASGRIFCTGESVNEPTSFGSTGMPIDLEKNIWILYAKDGDYIGANSSYDEYYDSQTSQTIAKHTMNLQYNCESTNGIFILNSGDTLEITQIPELDANVKIIVSNVTENEPSIIEEFVSGSLNITQNSQCYVRVEIDPPKYFKEAISIKFI